MPTYANWSGWVISIIAGRFEVIADRKAFPYRVRAMVDVTNALQPLAQRQCRISPSNVVDEIDATMSRVWRKSVLDQLRNDFLAGQVKDRAVFVLDLLVGLIDQVEDRMGVYVRGKYILQAVDL